MPKREIEVNENELLWGRLFLAAKVVERAREIELSRVNVSLIQAMVAVCPETLSRTADAVPTGQDALQGTSFHVCPDRPHGKGGSFTISNQGGIGGAQFTPIVNKPEVAILGLGRGALKAVVGEKKIESRLMLPLALSYDHRVIDGGSAARFMVDLVQALEQYPEQDVK